MKQLKVRCSQEFFWREIVDILYRNTLKKDDMWHFFFEGTYHVIRFNQIFEKDIKKFMEASEPLYEELQGEKKWWISDYRENIEVARKYLAEFIPIFHNLSLLAIKTDEEDVWGVTNRIFHCFNNMMAERDILQNHLNSTRANRLTEANVYMVHALMSAYSAGRRNP